MQAASQQEPGENLCFVSYTEWNAGRGGSGQAVRFLLHGKLPSEESTSIQRQMKPSVVTLHFFSSEMSQTSSFLLVKMTCFEGGGISFPKFNVNLNSCFDADSFGFRNPTSTLNMATLKK